MEVLPSGVTSTAVERELVETPGHSDSKGVASPSTSRGVGGLIKYGETRESPSSRPIYW